MKLHLLSDLHLEFGDMHVPETDADVVVLAGDIHKGVRGVEWAKQQFRKPVIYVPGNHEYYKQNFTTLNSKLLAAAEGSNVHVLLNNSLILDGVRFLGTTLWTDFALHDDTPAAMRAAQEKMNDYRDIRTGPSYKRLRPHDTRLAHQTAKEFLQKALAEPFDGMTVVVTHHAPSIKAIPEQYQGDAFSPCYASRLESLFGPAVNWWLHGHIHSTVNFTDNETRVMANPRGYTPKELSPTFDPAFVFELE